MNSKIMQILGLCTAIAVSCINTIGILPVKAEEIIQELTEAEESTSLVPVIVTIKGDAVLAHEKAAEQGTDFLDTSQAERIENSLLFRQSHVEAEIREIFPELEIGYYYSTLLNGFSCELPENLIAAVQQNPLVEDVLTVSEHFLPITPQMTDALTAGNVENYWEDTGCYGEGQVIAVLDSELDVTHSMFSAIDDKNNTLQYEDVTNIVKNGNLHIHADPSKAYRSSKLPFVVSYTNQDDIYDVANSNDAWYHGTHVCGIAAGNTVNYDGVPISGVAKDAQLIFMQVFRYKEDGSGQPGAATQDVLAAMEDAVKLHADVINMSLGSTTDWFQEAAPALAMQAAENADVTLCVSAGNEGDNTTDFLQSNNLVQNVDTSTLSNYAAAPTALAVASAYSGNQTAYQITLEDGTQIPYLGYYDASASYTFTSLVAKLGVGTYDYVYCENGTVSDFANKDVSGKLALIDQNQNILTALENAMNAGAVGIIIADQMREFLSKNYYTLGQPVAMVNQSAGQILKNAAVKKVTLQSAKNTSEVIVSQMSEFTSWGTSSTLDLKPDIMGVGEEVTSAGYNNSFSNKDGTSMASPYLAGCTAILKDYLEKNGLETTPLFLRNVLMNSAVPQGYYKTYVTPRRQGAGMVNMENALHDTVILTDSENVAKIRLGDNLKNNFSFDVNIQNLSSEDVTFTEASLVLQTDGYKTDESRNAVIIDSSIATSLTSTANVNSLLHVSAGESRTETISVKLDSAQVAELEQIFTNGFFVEGYLLLSGAENCCAVSIPLLGFHGDWSALPVWDLTGKEYDMRHMTKFGSRGIQSDFSLAQATEIAVSGMKNITSSLRDAGGSLFWYNLQTYVKDEDFWNRMNACIADNQNGTVYISPDGNNSSDTLGLETYMIRSATINGLKLYDTNGKLVADGEKNVPTSRHMEFIAEPTDSLTALPEGTYTADLQGLFAYQDESKTQHYQFPCVIDKTAPKVKTSLSEKNGKKILTITAEDANLDGIYITGKCTQSGTANTDVFTALDGLAYHFSYLNENGNFMSNGSDTVPEDASFVSRILGGASIDVDKSFIDFADVIPAEGTSFTTEYDVTNLSYYHIDVLDRAFNSAQVTAGQPEMTVFPAGRWKSINQGNIVYYAFNKNFTSGLFQLANSGTLYTQADGTSDTFTYPNLENGKTTLTLGGTQTAVSAEILPNYHIKLTWADGTTEELIYVTDIYSAFQFYTNEKLQQLASDYYLYTGKYPKPDSTSVTVNDDATVTITLKNESGKVLETYTVDPVNGIGTDSNGNKADLSLVDRAEGMLTPGTWHVSDQNGEYYYTVDMTGKYGTYRNLSDGSSGWFRLDYSTFGTGSYAITTITMTTDKNIEETIITLDWTDDTTVTVSPYGSDEKAIWKYIGDITLYGDVNCDGEVDILDVITLNRAVLGKEVLSTQSIVNADVNLNDVPDANDSLYILKFIVGLIQDFPIE